MELTKEHLIEGKIYPKGTKVEVVKESKEEKIEENFIDQDFQKWVDTLHNNEKYTDYSIQITVGKDSTVIGDEKGMIYMNNRNLVIVDMTNSQNSIWVSPKDVSLFQMNEDYSDAYIRLRSGGYLRLRNIK